MKKAILTFDVEEFDVPLEFGQTLSLDEQIAVSTRGTKALQLLLEKHNIPCTIFCTGQYALKEPSLVKSLSEKHEIASHGMYHSRFDAKKDLLDSKQTLEKITGKTVKGFRMARMMPVENEDIAQAGYLYNASLHPTFIPGRYNHLHKPKLPFREDLLWQVPATVSPSLRFPLFWLSFKNIPMFMYKKLSADALDTYGVINLYFHPWEFTDLSAYPIVPAYIKRHSGEALLNRLDAYIVWLKKRGVSFDTMENWVANLEEKEL